MDFPDPKTFYFDLPIYTPLKVPSDDKSQLVQLLTNKDTIDYYNPTLGENSTYKVSPVYSTHIGPFIEYGGTGYAMLSCVRTGEEYYFYYYYNAENETFMKVGQYPSIATFHISQVKRYNKILDKEKLKEFTRAIGLAANGVGIGSFVYLRRIFEGLIEEAHAQATTTENWDEKTYSGSRMAEKIGLLSAFLPEFLVENKSLYGILSVGIHALTEKDCLAYFETVRVGIELILDEKLELFEKKKKVEDAKQKLSALTATIKATKD